MRVAWVAVSEAVGWVGGAPRAAIGGGGFRNAQASVGAVRPSGNFASRGVVAGGYGRGGNWHNGGWHNGGRHGYYRPGVGFVTGLAVGSALGYGYGGYYGDDDYAYNDGYYDAGDPGYVVSSNDDSGYCAQRYKSYDPASGTYLGYDGQRHPCP